MCAAVLTWRASRRAPQRDGSSDNIGRGTTHDSVGHAQLDAFDAVITHRRAGGAAVGVGVGRDKRAN